MKTSHTNAKNHLRSKSARTTPSESKRQNSILDCDIFERSLSTGLIPVHHPSFSSSDTPHSEKLRSAGTSVSSLSLSQYSPEDYIPPVLDLSTELLTDPEADLDKVHIITCDCKEHRFAHLNCSVCPECNGRSKALAPPPSFSTIKWNEKKHASDVHTHAPIEEENDELMFLSFADLVRQENEPESLHCTNLKNCIL